MREVQQGVAKEPWWVEYSKSFFPVILIVFLLRSFLVEPFKIPSGSMIPTLLVGDFILVNKFTYGIRLPMINVKLIDIDQPQRGGCHGVPLSGKPLARLHQARGRRTRRSGGLHRQAADDQWPGHVATRRVRLSVRRRRAQNYMSAKEYVEELSGREHSILINPAVPPVQLANVRQFPHRDNCEYNERGFVCRVPQGHYFLMGDNRDSSSDSRYWGFVPERNIVGKAFMIWWNFGDFGRIGHSIKVKGSPDEQSNGV